MPRDQRDQRDPRDPRDPRQRRLARDPADPPWHRDPTLLFIALPALAWLALTLFAR